MPWSHNTRCLYCEGELPFYRRLTLSRFCSKAHREKYSDEQQQRAIERLDQTRSDIQAYRPPEPIENMIGPFESAPAVHSIPDAPTVETAGAETVSGVSGMMPAFAASDQPSAAGFLASAIDPIGGQNPALLSTGSLEIEPAIEMWPAPHRLSLASAPFSMPLLEKQLEIAGLDAQDCKFARSGAVMPVSLRGPEVAFPLPAELSRAPAFETAPDYEPPLVEKLKDLGWPEARVETARIRRTGVEANYIHAAGSPDIGSWLPPAPPAANHIHEAGLLPLVLAAATAASGAPRGHLEPYASKAPGPSLGRVSAPAPTVVTGNLQALSIEPHSPAPLSRMTPHVAPIAPAALASVVVEGTPRAERPACALQQDGRIAMRHVLTVSPANRRAKPGLGRDVLPELQRGQRLLPKLHLQPVAIEIAPRLDPPLVSGAVLEAEVSKRGVMAGIHGYWTQVSRGVKLLSVAIPVAIGLGVHSLPDLSVSASEGDGPPSGFRQALDEQFANLRRTVANRAAIALDEDFRGGIGQWISRTGATAEWSFDATGFVQPGPLALYEPSLKLTDYRVQFLGMIDEKAMSWVVRARSFENYYVLKLVVLNGGPLPTIGLTRYAVIDGKPVDRVDRPVRVNARPDTLYRVRMDVHGSDFALDVQGQTIDAWSEPRLTSGGVGFFAGRGEKSSIRWVQLTHHYDVLGRLCAYLVPYEF